VQRLRDALNAIDADVTQLDQLIDDVVGGAPGNLDTLNNLADAINNDPDFANNIAAQLAERANADDVWTKSQADSRYLQGVTQTENIFTGNGTQTAFTLTQTPPSKESLLVSADGVIQPTSEYSLTGNTLALSEAPASGVKVRVLMLGYTGGVQPTGLGDPQPKWTGKLNGWPDPFFRKLTALNAFSFYGRNRWYTQIGGQFGSWSLVNNTIFDGNALRRNVTATTGPLNGPAIWFSDLGATLGSQVTICALVTGNGASMQMYGRTHSTSPGAFVGTQNSFTNVNNQSVTTTTSTPQLLKLTLTVAANEQGLSIYTTHTQNTLYYDIVALWAFNGSLESGPSWPTLQDELRAEVAINTANIATNATNIATNAANIATNAANLSLAVSFNTSVSSTSSTTTLDGSGFGTATRDLPFTGWGERYSPAGISFNAIQIASLTRTAALETSKWRNIYVVVKAAASSAQNSTNVVAIGSALVDPNSSTLTNLTILLRDPATNALKTLTNADLSSEYFIGVYARNLTGASASCGEPRGTMPNTLSQSFYITSGNPLSNGWATYTSNIRLGFRHLLLAGPVEGLNPIPTNALTNSIESNLLADPTFVNSIVSQVPVDSTPELILPPFLYGVQGREANVYFDNLLLDDASRFNIDVTSASSTGLHQNERWTWTPSGAMTTGALTISLSSKSSGTQLVSKSANQRAAASSAGSGTNKKVMLIGDSLTNAGVITQTLLDIAASDVMGVTLYGTRGSGSNKHEGRGGWSVSSYTSATHVDNNPNPFWNGSAVNFSWYLTQNSYPALDWVFVQLGTNDVYSQTSDSGALSTTTTQLTLLDTLINSIKASDANTKVGLLIPPPPSSDQDSFGANYTTGQTRWRFKRNILIWAREMVAKYTGQEASRIYLVPTNTALDTVNNMARDAAAPINSRNSGVTVARQSNGVHPASSGYQQIGDALWAFLKCQS
jgi:lysophospholipase L1-like esterase